MLSLGVGCEVQSLDSLEFDDVKIEDYRGLLQHTNSVRQLQIIFFLHLHDAGSAVQNNYHPPGYFYGKSSMSQISDRGELDCTETRLSVSVKRHWVSEHARDLSVDGVGLRLASSGGWFGVRCSHRRERGFRVALASRP